MLRLFTLFAAFFPIFLSAQSPVLIPPPILGGSIGISTLNLLDITVQNSNLISQHALRVSINYAPVCDGAFQPVSFLDIPHLILNDLGKIEQTVLSSYDASWQYNNGDFKAFIYQTGHLPPGCFEVCYQYVEPIEGFVTTTCIQFNVQSDFPFYLLTPFDQAVVDDPYPILSWTPYEASPNCTYQLTLAEIYPGQSDMEAIISNAAKYFESGLTSTFLQYSSLVSPLENCRHYVWRVDVLNGDVLLKSSEVWQFDTKCDEIFNPVVANETYHFLTDDKDNVPFNVIGDTLRFVLNHSYDKIENYTITMESLNTSSIIDVKPVLIPSSTIGQTTATPTVDQPIDNPTQTETDAVTAGQNYCLVDLKTLGFVPGDYYLLRASNQNNTYFLYFLYYQSM